MDLLKMMIYRILNLKNSLLLYESHVGFHVYHIYETTERVLSHILCNDIDIFNVFQMLDPNPLHFVP